MNEAMRIIRYLLDLSDSKDKAIEELQKVVQEQSQKIRYLETSFKPGYQIDPEKGTSITD